MDAAFAVLRDNPDEAARLRALWVLRAAPDRKRTVVPRLVMELVRIATVPPWAGPGRNLGVNAVEASKRANAPYLTFLLWLSPEEAAPAVDVLVLLHFLKTRSGRFSRDLTSYLGYVVRMGEAALPALVRMVDSNDADIRRAAMEILGEFPTWPPGLERKFVRNLELHFDAKSIRMILYELRERGVHEPDSLDELRGLRGWVQSQSYSVADLPRAEYLEALDSILAGKSAKR